MRILILFLLLVPLAVALPAPPELPPPPFPDEDVFLTVTLDPVTATVNSTAATALECVLALDASLLEDIFLGTPLPDDDTFILEPGNAQTFPLTPDPGEHEVEVACSVDFLFDDLDAVFYDVQTIVIATGDCTIDADCTVEEACIDGICILAGCVDDTECYPDETCIDHACVSFACVHDADCAAHERCVAGLCEVAGCTTDAECTGQVCAAGACVDCVNTTDCQTGVCVAGQCTEDVQITLIDPPAHTTGTTNVSFVHDASTNGLCTVRIDGVQLDQTLVEPWTLTVFPYTLPSGPHTVNVSCHSSTWTAAASKPFTVTGTTSTITTNTTHTITIHDFSSSAANTGGNNMSTLSARANEPFVYDVNATDTLQHSLTFSDDTTLFTITSTGRITFTPTAAQTQSTPYSIIITATDGNISKNRTLTLTIQDSPPNVTLNPTILPLADVRKQTAFTVQGTGFAPADALDLVLTGHGATRRNETTTSATGSFSHTYDGLDVDTYYIVARSKASPSVLATLSFTVIPPPVFEPPRGPTFDEPRDDPWENPTEDVDATINTQVERTAPPQRPTPRSPAPIADTEPLDEPSGSGWIWIVLIFVLFGGVIGFLVYTGALDVSSVGAFQRSVTSMFDGGLPHGTKTEKLEKLQQAQEGLLVDDVKRISTFIMQERKKGFDDLTIRSALLAKGWEKEKVDKVFDRVYGGSS